MIGKDNKLLPPSGEQTEEIRRELLKLRKELRERISREEFNHSWLSEALDCIFMTSQVDVATFHRFWIRPLLAAGLTPEKAITCVVDSYFLPN